LGGRFRASSAAAFAPPSHGTAASAEHRAGGRRRTVALIRSGLFQSAAIEGVFPFARVAARAFSLRGYGEGANLFAPSLDMETL